MVAKLKSVRVDLRLKVRNEIDLDKLAREICEAVETWGGQRRRSDPLYYGISVQQITIFQRGIKMRLEPKPPMEIEELYEGED